MSSIATARMESPDVAAMLKAVRIGILSPINKLDPRDAVDYVSAVVLAQVFETPYTMSAGETSARPLLFEPLRREDSTGDAYSAAIRSGIVFSDGTPLTADIAARSLRNASVLKNKATVDVRDGRVFFTLTAPNPRFELALTQSSCAIVLDKGLQLFGTGPFMFDHRPNLRLLQTAPVLRLTRNPNCHRSTSVDEVQFVVLPAEADGTPRKLIEALRNGEVDVTTVLSSADVTAQRLTSHAASMHPANSTAVLFLNSQRRLLGTLDVRRGIATGINLHEIAATAYERNPAAFVAGSVLPPSMGRSIGMPRADRQQARKLVEDGGASGAQMTMVVPWGPRPYLPKPMAIATVIQRQLAEIGISLSIVETKNSDDFFSYLYSGRFDLALAGWIADTPDPADFYEALLWSKSIGSEGHSNYGRWQDAATDVAIERFRAMPIDANRRLLDGIVQEQAPFIPLIYGQSTVLHSRKLRNVAVSPNGVLPVGDIVMA